jgi:azurin
LKVAHTALIFNHHTDGCTYRADHHLEGCKYRADCWPSSSRLHILRWFLTIILKVAHTALIVNHHTDGCTYRADHHLEGCTYRADCWPSSSRLHILRWFLTIILKVAHTALIVNHHTDGCTYRADHLLEGCTYLADF